MLRRSLYPFLLLLDKFSALNLQKRLYRFSNHFGTTSKLFGNVLLSFACPGIVIHPSYLGVFVRACRTVDWLPGHCITIRERIWPLPEEEARSHSVPNTFDTNLNNSDKITNQRGKWCSRFHNEWMVSSLIFSGRSCTNLFSFERPLTNVHSDKTNTWRLFLQITSFIGVMHRAYNNFCVRLHHSHCLFRVYVISRTEWNTLFQYDLTDHCRNNLAKCYKDYMFPRWKCATVDRMQSG